MIDWLLCHHSHHQIASRVAICAIRSLRGLIWCRMGFHLVEALVTPLGTAPISYWLHAIMGWVEGQQEVHKHVYLYPGRLLNLLSASLDLHQPFCWPRRARGWSTGGVSQIGSRCKLPLPFPSPSLPTAHPHFRSPPPSDIAACYKMVREIEPGSEIPF